MMNKTKSKTNYSLVWKETTLNARLVDSHLPFKRMISLISNTHAKKKCSIPFLNFGESRFPGSCSLPVDVLWGSFATHSFLPLSVGEKWMRDERAPKDVCGEAMVAVKSCFPLRCPTFSRIPHRILVNSVIPKIPFQTLFKVNFWCAVGIKRINKKTKEYYIVPVVSFVTK